MLDNFEGGDDDLDDLLDEIDDMNKAPKPMTHNHRINRDSANSDQSGTTKIPPHNNANNGISRGDDEVFGLVDTASKN